MRFRTFVVLAFVTAASCTSPEVAVPNLTPSPQPPETPAPTEALSVEEFDLPAGSGPHDVAPAPGGGVWYTAQRSGDLGLLDPRDGSTHHIELGAGSAPHGVIVGPDDAAWVTDGGLNAVVRVDPDTEEVEVFRLPSERAGSRMNTATFDADGVLWFTGQAGVYGSLDPATGEMQVFDAPGGAGPYGITTTPGGDVYYASLAGNHIARIDVATGRATRIDPPTPGQGARRVWSDSSGRIWVSEWRSGQVSVYDPDEDGWQAWTLPGEGPQPYAVYVDDRDMVWLSDFGANSIVGFDPGAEEFTAFELPRAGSNVRQILGRPGEIWGGGSGVDTLIVVRAETDTAY